MNQVNVLRWLPTGTLSLCVAVLLWHSVGTRSSTNLAERPIVNEHQLQSASQQQPLRANTPSNGSNSIQSAQVDEIDFRRDIRPILSNNCFSCHGPDESFREADLRLDSADDVYADRGGYAAILPNNLDDSEVWQRIIAEEDSGIQMPPLESGKELTTEEKEFIRLWIEQGAPWSGHWAYQLPQQVSAPGDDETVHWIDRWVRHRLGDRGLTHARQAEPHVLLRRLSFDLRGLPPNSEEVAQFLQNWNEADNTNQVIEDWVDRFLDSPHFGERMAVYWLDLVRYADTVGYHGDQDHNISPYRDYVIDAFNRNVPFDQFTREQLAGDLLSQESVDQLIATGYNRLLQTSHEGGVQPKEYLTMYAADRVRNVSAVWMGATVGCAQCHSHKYDPYTIKDFYALSAFFADVDEEQHFRVGSNSLPTRRPPEIEVLSRRQRERVEAIDQRIDELSQLDSSGRTATEQERIELEISQLQSERESIQSSKRMTMVTQTVEPRVTRILPRGNWLDESGDVVDPAIPSFLGTLDVGDRRANRLDLANWLVDYESGNGALTARVMVNRLWYLLLGTGLSRDLADFGGQGIPPRHPELLDQLALAYIDLDWNTKAIIKLIVMSKTYQQTSLVSPAVAELDPLNEYYARQSRYRLPAEFIRDNALAVSGLLNDEIGGVSAKPYQPNGYYRHLNFPTRTYQHDANRNQWRRGVYVHWQRQFLHPMLQAFDAPRREECTAERPRSNTPIAALAQLNDPTFVESAKHFARRILLNGPSQSFDERIDFAFGLAVSREPDAFERDTLQQLYRREQERFQSNPDRATAVLSVGLTMEQLTVDNETLDSIEWAIWMSIARVLLNLAETNIRP